MANQKSFAVAPTVSISRSKFVKNSQQKTSWNLGEIVPVYLQEVLPGETMKMDIASLVRMSTPIVPIMDNIHMDIYAFYAPNRILWEHWKDFMGENNDGAGIEDKPEYMIPQCSIYQSDAGIEVNSLGDHLGLPYLDTETYDYGELSVSALPGRMYKIIYNEWFRDQNVEAPHLVDIGDLGDTDMYGEGLEVAYKDHDYFTSCLPYAQKGAPVTIPLGTLAPVYPDAIFTIEDPEYGQRLTSTFDGAYRFANPLYYGFQDTDSASNIAENMVSQVGTLGLGDGKIHFIDDDEGDYVDPVVPSNLVADLSRATAGTINQLRFAFQYQKLLEKDALYGTRYWEILKGHFGVNAPDASLQRPEYLGHKRVHINIDQVLQTTGSNQLDPEENSLGATGAVSVSGDKASLFTKSFVEHGYVMVLAVCRHDQTYGQGIEKHWSRKTRTDFYFPEFANLGSQPVLNKELYVAFDDPNAATPTEYAKLNDEVFGYQEAWVEYRTKPSYATAYLKPSNANSLAYWTLANNFSATPTLGEEFLKQGRENLARALTTGDMGPDFIGDFFFHVVDVLPMPMYSIPGLVDHH